MFLGPLVEEAHRKMHLTSRPCQGSHSPNRYSSHRPATARSALPHDPFPSTPQDIPSPTSSKRSRTPHSPAPVAKPGPKSPENKEKRVVVARIASKRHKQAKCSQNSPYSPIFTQNTGRYRQASMRARHITAWDRPLLSFSTWLRPIHAYIVSSMGHASESKFRVTNAGSMPFAQASL